MRERSACSSSHGQRRFHLGKIIEPRQYGAVVPEERQAMQVEPEPGIEAGDDYHLRQQRRDSAAEIDIPPESRKRIAEVRCAVR